MDKMFPVPEDVELEEIYGSKRTEAHPHSNPTTHNLTPTTLFPPEPPIPILVPAYSTWFDTKHISSIERQSLPEFFTDPVTEHAYQEWRNMLFEMYQGVPNRYLSVSLARKSVNCDIVSLIRIHAFMEKWGLINYRVDVRREIAGGMERCTGGGTGGVGGAHGGSMRDSMGSMGTPYPPHAHTQTQPPHIQPPYPPHTSHPSHRRLVGVAEPLVPPPDLLTPSPPTASATLIPERITCRCGKTVSDNILFSTAPTLFLCEQCFEEGKYPPQFTSCSFFKLSSSIVTQAWTRKEELLLLEGIEKHADDWKKVSEYVKTKGVEQCVLHFLKLPVQDRLINKHLAAMSVEEVPVSMGSNPVMGLVAFLCGSVHPSVAAEAARWAIKRYSGRAEELAALTVAVSVTKAQAQRDVEEKKLERLLAVLVESELKKIEMKMEDFKELCGYVERERVELGNARAAYQKEVAELKELIQQKRAAE